MYHLFKKFASEIDFCISTHELQACFYFFHAHVQFNHAFPVSSNDPGYRSNPSLEDQTFCLVNVIAADKISLMCEGVIDKLKKIRQEATDLRKPELT